MSSADRGAIEVLVVLLGLAALGAAAIISRRTTLRPWMLVLPLVTVAVCVPLAIPLVHDIRLQVGGESAAWGRMAEVIVLMAIIPLIAIATGALLALVVLLPRRGFIDDATLRAQRGPWYTALFRRRTPVELRHRLYIQLGAIVLVGILWLLGVRPGS